MRLRRGLFLALALVASLLVAGVALAQSGGGYDLTWWTMDGGGATLGGGSYSLVGTAGQPEPGAALTGGGYTLVSGFWPAAGTGSGGGDFQIYLPLVVRS